MTYLAVSALSHIGAVRDHHEDSLVAGPWTLCAAVTESVTGIDIGEFVTPVADTNTCPA